MNCNLEVNATVKSGGFFLCFSCYDSYLEIFGFPDFQLIRNILIAFRKIERKPQMQTFSVTNIGNKAKILKKEVKNYKFDKFLEFSQFCIDGINKDDQNKSKYPPLSA